MASENDCCHQSRWFEEKADFAFAFEQNKHSLQSCLFKTLGGTEVKLASEKNRKVNHLDWEGTRAIVLCNRT